MFRRAIISASLAVTLLFSLGQPDTVEAATSHFTASLATSNLDNPASGSTATGTVSLVLNEPDGGAPTLDYSIRLLGLELDPGNTDPEDVWGIHFHHAPIGSAGPHVLNIYGRPRVDDADAVVDTVANSVQGRWDDGDENWIPIDPLQPIGPGNIDPGSSHPLSNFIDALKNEELFVVVHSWGQNGNPEIGGRIIAVPEPSTGLLCGVLALLGVGRRRSPR
ncbi:MAG: CHRD domain-containing protein [Planctomycetales bacterium]|nr:CHRD domain-containing protein [Planctomycetales bacterium]